MSERDEISLEISEKVGAQAESTRRANRRGAYFWLIMVAYMVTSPAIAILVSRQISISGTIRSEQKLCTVVITTDDAWLTNPPTSPAGIRQAENFHKLRRDLKCPPPQEGPK